MSKELLEETENKMVEFRQLLALVTGHNDILNKAAHIHEIVIKQAERVQELEKDIKEWEIVNESWEEINTVLGRQNKRYREALEEIVYQENLKETNVFGYDHEDISSYVEEVARKALEGEE